jgi:hypothetical protein
VLPPKFAVAATAPVMSGTVTVQTVELEQLGLIPGMPPNETLGGYAGRNPVPVSVTCVPAEPLHGVIAATVGTLAAASIPATLHVVPFNRTSISAAPSQSGPLLFHDVAIFVSTDAQNQT